MDDTTSRDRIRALVRDVLDKALPGEAAPSSATPSRFIDTAPTAPSPTAVTVDESSKSVITEDDVRDLAAGSVLRICRRRAFDAPCG